MEKKKMTKMEKEIDKIMEENKIGEYLLVITPKKSSKVSYFGRRSAELEINLYFYLLRHILKKYVPIKNPRAHLK